MDLAPIILFAYNRPEHTRRTLEALSQNVLADQSELYIYVDGIKEKASEDDGIKNNEVKQLTREKKWCKEVYVIEREKNYGLADNIVSGVTEIVNKYGKIIVLEDDIVTSPGFLKYMNDSLDLYENEEKIMHISAYQYPIKYVPKDNTIILNILSCWGWATWARAWKNYNGDINYLYDKISISKKRIKKFDINDGAHFYEQLVLNKEGQLKTWAVKWYASWLLKGGNSLFPKYSLVKNIGHDNTGVHCGTNEIYQSKTINVLEIKKQQIIEDKKARKAANQFFKENFKQKKKKKHLIPRLKNKIYRKGRDLFFRFFPELRSNLLNIQHAQLWTISKHTSNSTISKLSKPYPPYRIIDSEIGDFTYIAQNSSISIASIGKFCSIGPNLICGWGIHPTNGISTNPMFYSTLKQNGITLSETNKIEERKKITIGNDVFIGANVTILDGVTVGNGAIIGAGAVVVKDIPDYAIAVGVPAKVIKYRFNEDIIEKLLKLKWWELNDLESLKLIEKHFFEVEKFIEELNIKNNE